DVSGCPYGWNSGTPCPTPKDAQYLQYVYASFLRFAKVGAAEDVAVAEGGNVTMEVTLYDGTGNAVSGTATQLMFEVELEQEKWDFLVGSDPTTTPNGTLVTAAGPDSGGKFTVVARAKSGAEISAQEAAGVVFVLQTLDQSGATSSARQCAFQGSSVVGSVFSPFTSVDISSNRSGTTPPPGGSGGSPPPPAGSGDTPPPPADPAKSPPPPAGSGDTPHTAC
ncbi:hypothetical protein CYMTET_35966, partial [Cymbomonas tetramitiformis]